MTEFKILFILIIALSIFGCKTTKTVVKASSDTKTHEQAVISTKAVETTNAVKTISYVEQAESSDQLEETIVEETFSAPDSAGKQHITSRKTTDRKRGWTENTIGCLNTNDEVLSKIKESTEAELQVKTTVNLDTKETVKTVSKTPAIFPLLVVAVVGLVVVYVNRKQILKWICIRLLKK